MTDIIDAFVVSGDIFWLFRQIDCIPVYVNFYKLGAGPVEHVLQ